MLERDWVTGDQIAGARDYQEDTFRIVQLSRKDKSNELLILLADGMGGHIGGAHASKLAISTFATQMEQISSNNAGQRLQESLDVASAAITKYISDNPLYTSMGCTLLACLLAGNELHWVSVGDSPLWLLRDNEMQRLNADHSMRPVLDGLVELGRMTAEELANDPRVNQLRSVLSGEELTMIDQNEAPLPLLVGDQIILASDGIETLTVDEIAKICMAHQHPQTAVATLLDAVTAQQVSYQDNATVVIYQHPQTPATDE